jgi:hypothetical protein
MLLKLYSVLGTWEFCEKVHWHTDSLGRCVETPVFCLRQGFTILPSGPQTHYVAKDWPQTQAASASPVLGLHV